MVYQYSWRESAELREQVEAQVVGERLAAIAADAEGTLRPQDVVADARSAQSPLHPLFEWDDRKAATAHRLHQAKSIIKAIVVEFVGQPEATMHYVGQRDTQDRSGSSFVAVAITPAEETFTRVPASERARLELERWVRRYGDRPELAEATRHAREAIEALAAAVV